MPTRKVITTARHAATDTGASVAYWGEADADAAIAADKREVVCGIGRDCQQQGVRTTTCNS